MKRLEKEDICVFIENATQLEEVRLLLKRYGEKVTKLDKELYAPVSNYLRYQDNIGWYLNTSFMKKKITLKGLEAILNFTTYLVTFEINTPIWKKVLRFFKFMKQREEFQITLSNNSLKVGDTLLYHKKRKILILKRL